MSRLTASGTPNSSALVTRLIVIDSVRGPNCIYQNVGKQKIDSQVIENGVNGYLDISKDSQHYRNLILWQTVSEA